MPQALKIPDAKAAVEKELEKLDKIPAWELTNVRNKNEVIDEARNKCKTVRFASLMDLQPFQKDKGRSLLRGDSGSCAVFTAQGIISITNDGCKSNGRKIKIMGIRRTSSRRNMCLHPGQNGRCTIIVENSEVRMSRYLETSTKSQMA